MRRPSHSSHRPSALLQTQMNICFQSSYFVEFFFFFVSSSFHFIALYLSAFFQRPNITTYVCSCVVSYELCVPNWTDHHHEYIKIFLKFQNRVRSNENWESNTKKKNHSRLLPVFQFHQFIYSICQRLRVFDVRVCATHYSLAWQKNK